MKIFMIVTKDECEQVLASADSQAKLARTIGVNKSSVCRGLQGYRAGRRTKYREVEVEDDEYDK